MLGARTMLILTTLISWAAAWQGMAGEPVEDLLAATFRITDGEHSGTCFFVKGRGDDSSNNRRVILVTAAHVLDQMSGSECELILRSENAEKGYSRNVVSIVIREDDKPAWTHHPDVDIATMLIELPEGVAAKSIPLDQIADEARLINRTVRVGQEAWISCFPAKLESNAAGWPVLRKGSIASYPLIPLKSAKTILIDYKVFGGDSGAPVAVIVNNELLIVGVASSMQRQTDKSSLPFEERTMHTPLGLSIVVQAAYLRETIDLIK